MYRMETRAVSSSNLESSFPQQAILPKHGFPLLQVLSLNILPPCYDETIIQYTIGTCRLKSLSQDKNMT